MKESTLLSFSDFDSIKQISSSGIEYWSARDVRDLLKYTAWRSFENTLKQAMRTCRFAKQEVEHHFVMIQRRAEQGRAYRMITDYTLTRYALHLLLTHCDAQKPEIALALAYLTHNSLGIRHDYIAFAQEIGVLIVDDITLSKEQEAIGQIVRAFKHHETIKQYKVDGYRVDLYFPVHRIAIECDEHGHGNYCVQEECLRQEYIEKMLDCTFVRYNPDVKNFNIIEVIQRIMMLIYHR